jgi:hypothetical protein
VIIKVYERLGTKLQEVIEGQVWVETESSSSFQVLLKPCANLWERKNWVIFDHQQSMRDGPWARVVV